MLKSFLLLAIQELNFFGWRPTISGGAANSFINIWKK